MNTKHINILILSILCTGNFSFTMDSSSEDCPSSSDSSSENCSRPKVKSAYLKRYRIKDENYVPRSFPVHSHTRLIELHERKLPEALAFCDPGLLAKVTQLKNSESLRGETRPNSQLLLTGDGYNGKTTLAYALAHTYENPYVFISTPALCDEYKDGYVDIIDNIFKPWFVNKKPATLIFDEICSFTRRIDNETDMDRLAPAHLLEKMREAKKENPLLLIVCICRKYKDLSRQYQKYFATEHYYIDFPSELRREHILNNGLSHLNLPQSFIQKLVRKTDGHSTGMIDHAISELRDTARIRAEVQGMQPTITEEEVEEIILKKPKKGYCSIL